MRKNAAPKRPVVKDPVYNSEQVTQLVNKVLIDGKKSTAERIVYGALEICREKTGTEPVGTLEKALGNIRPRSEERRVGKECGTRKAPALLTNAAKDEVIE